MCSKIYVFLLFVSCGVTAVIEANKQKKLIIDNDAGGDDAMAIFLAVLYEKHYNGPPLIGLTTTNGNTNEDNVFINNQKILQVANRQDIPIYRGSKSSLVHTLKIDDWFGADGLGDTDDVYSDLKPAHTMPAVEALIELSKLHKGELIVVTTGPLTNVALAMKIDPDFLNRLAHLYVAAGKIDDGQSNKSDVEFNVNMDVEAYRIVADNANPDKVTFIPFSQVVKHLDISNDWRNNVFGAIDSDIVRAQNKFEKKGISNMPRWHALDPAAVAAVINPDLVKEYKYSLNNIIVCGEDRGTVTNTFLNKNESNARIVYSYKKEEYQQFLLDVFSA